MAHGLNEPMRVAVHLMVCQIISLKTPAETVNLLYYLRHYTVTMLPAMAVVQCVCRHLANGHKSLAVGMRGTLAIARWHFIQRARVQNPL